MHRVSNSRSGFTVLELVLFSAIFSLVSIAFISVLVAVVRIQSRQGASNDVNQQSNLALSTIQRLVEQSSNIEGTAGVASSGLMLRMASSSIDPTFIYVSGNSLWLQQGTSSATTLLTSSVSVSTSTFTKRTNAGGKDSVSVQLTINNASASTTRNVARVLDVFVSRVSAATFDADLLPSASTYKLGTGGSLWQSINDLIYFSSSNVGIGVSNPGSKFEVNGGVRLNTATSKPTCASGIRGTLWFTQAGSGSADVLEACMRNASSSYVWMALY